ncbi:MAG TPA: HEAT repeat domain-containing protein [Thermoanaerobaculia bacterium]
MSECSAMKESMPLLLTESLDPARREQSHQHIEACAACSEAWLSYQQTWVILGDLPEVEVPPRIREAFLSKAGIAQAKNENVIAFRRKPVFKWLAQAAAIAVIAGGGYFAGHTRAPRIESSPATIDGVALARQGDFRPISLVETRQLDANALSPEIEGRPNITNVQFVDSDASDDQIGVSFDITSRWTVTGNPRERSMIRLLSYMLENEAAVSPRSNALEWVRQTYSDPANADPEIANALARVLRNDTHEGVRIRAVETLTTLPPAVASDTRDALINALKNDPNPAVRLKAVEALANMARSGSAIDPALIDTLRQKASQDDENLYVRVKAAEVLSSMNP